MEITIKEKTYIVKDFLPFNVSGPMTNFIHEGDLFKAMRFVLNKMVTDPKLSEQYMMSDKCDGFAMELLYGEIMEKHGLNEARMEELKKKDLNALD